MGNDIEGRLSKLGLPMLLSMLEMERRSGVVWCENDDERLCKLTICEGRVVDVWTPDEHRREAREVVCELLVWVHGDFSFQQQDITTKDRIGMSTTHLLLEAAQLRDVRDRDG